ncbi:HD domain-containing protein, partial [bacterium]|nr:HD domain-containing protein [bacterium]
QKILGVLLVAAPGERTFAPNEIRLLDTIAEITGNALYRAQLHQQTERRLQNLQALRKIDRAISSSFNMRPGLQTILIYSLSQLGVDAAAVLLFHPALQTLEYESGQGFYTRAIERTLVRLGDGHAGRAALEGHTTYLTNLNEASADFTRASLLAGEHFIGYCVVPLISKGEIRGVLEVFSRAELHPSPDWLNFLETLAGQTAIAIDNAQLFENLQRSNLEISLAYDATIEGWSRALELRDEETEGHTQRVTDLAMNLAKRCKLSEQEMLHLRRGALLHDIGKIGVPDSILLKPGPLNDEERRIMQSHVQLAYEMLLPIEYLHPALDIPYCHHEKWDGSGYPRGLKGQEIPIAARIFAVADVWDALTSDRPYRPAWTKENTLEYLRAQSGKHFDPQVLEKFMEILEKKKGSPILHGDVSEKEKGQ